VKLSPPMQEALRLAAAGFAVRKGPTRAALMRRGLLYNMTFPAELRGTITDRGREAAAEMDRKG
jgi:hypothetical protein